jgi:hypothetical protein
MKVKTRGLKGKGNQRELEVAVEEIALEIDDRDEAEEFVAEAWKRLRALRS